MSETKIERFVSDLLEENTYLVHRDGRGFLVDPGCKAEIVENRAMELGVTIEAALLTHGHFDHAGRARHFQNAGAKLYASERDALKLKNKANLSLAAGLPFDYTSPDGILRDGDVFSPAGIPVRVIGTPGHTDGGLCFIVEDANALFTGDTLFNMGYGRTDLPTGDPDDLSESLNRLFSLDKNYDIYPGHGDFSTLDREKKFNPFRAGF